MRVWKNAFVCFHHILSWPIRFKFLRAVSGHLVWRVRDVLCNLTPFCNTFYHITFSWSSSLYYTQFSGLLEDFFKKEIYKFYTLPPQKYVPLEWGSLNFRIVCLLPKKVTQVSPNKYAHLEDLVFFMLLHVHTQRITLLSIIKLISRKNNILLD
mgnify:CR=1 FL=1